MPAAQTAVQKMTDLRIQRALAKPGAIGMRGLLLWTEAAWPRAIANKILQAAGKYTPGAGRPVTLASPQYQGFSGFRGRFGFLGDDAALADVGISVPDISSDTTAAINAAASAPDPTVPPVSGVTVATPAQPASSSWLNDVSSAMVSATQGFLAATQVSDAQKLFNVNLQRAQQGLSPIGSNPTVYGLPAPTANLSLGSNSTLILVGAGVLALAMLGMGGRGAAK